MNKIPDSVWPVIVDHFREFYGMGIVEDVRKELEAQTEIRVFEGGVFIIAGNSFDIFVEPEYRGKWNSGKLIPDLLDELIAKHGKVVAVINERNQPSMRMAKKYGFTAVSRDSDGDLIMEKT